MNGAPTIWVIRSVGWFILHSVIVKDGVPFVSSATMSTEASRPHPLQKTQRMGHPGFSLFRGCPFVHLRNIRAGYKVVSRGDWGFVQAHPSRQKLARLRGPRATCRPG